MSIEQLLHLSILPVLFGLTATEPQATLVKVFQPTLIDVDRRREIGTFFYYIQIFLFFSTRRTDFILKKSIIFLISIPWTKLRDHSPRPNSYQWDGVPYIKRIKRINLQLSCGFHVGTPRKRDGAGHQWKPSFLHLLGLVALSNRYNQAVFKRIPQQKSCTPRALTQQHVWACGCQPCMQTFCSRVFQKRCACASTVRVPDMANGNSVLSGDTSRSCRTRGVCSVRRRACFFSRH